MALAVGENSYISVEDADAFFADIYAPEVFPWQEADDTAKEQALITATRRIDAQSYLGRKKDPEQLLQFPRCYAATVEEEATEVCDLDILPHVKAATCEEALAILAGESGDEELRAKLQAQGVTSAKIGSTSETFSGAGAWRAGLSSGSAAEYLKPYRRAVSAFA